MKKLFLSTFLLLAMTALVLAQDTDPLPFGVTVGGQAAAKTEGNTTHASVPKPVKSGAEMAVQGVKGQVIVNIWPSQEDGKAVSGAQPEILIFDAGAKKSINANMNGKAIPAGWHLANVVAEGKTSRVLFQVK